MPTDAPWTTALDLPVLRVELRPGDPLPSVSVPWFDVRVHTRSAPFAGTVESAWFTGDLRALRAALTGIVAVAEEESRWRPGDVLPGDDESPVFTVGGNRAAELRLSGGLASSGDAVWLTAWVTPNGDDPYPALHLHTFEDRAALTAHLGDLDALLEAAR